MRFHIVRLAALVLGVTLQLAPTATAGQPLYDAIRRNDVKAVHALIAQGADIRTPDESGATPLMYAALYAGPDVLVALIEHGAAVNVANKYGATPLMWAAANARNTRLLIERGADVRARASDGTTPLVAAARHSSLDAMRLLLAAGADTSAQEVRTGLLTAAYFATTPEVRTWLRGRGIEVKGSIDVKGPVLNRSRGDLAALRSLLDAGVSPTEEVPLITLSLPSFFMAAREGQLDALRTFVKAGADPNLKGPKGWTALMLVAGSDTASVPVLQYLIDAGGDLNAVDADGRTALDWALTRGETVVSRFLRAAGARPSAEAGQTPTPPSTPRRPADAVAAAVTRLQPVGPAFYNRTKCNSCHNQNIPGMAIAAARRRGVPIDESLAGHSLDASGRNLGGNRRESILLGDTNAGGFQANALYTLLEMGVSHLPPTPLSDALVIGLASRQGPDGSLPLVTDIRPPLTGSSLTATALAVRAFGEYAPEGLRPAMHARIDRALAFVRSATPRDTQEQVFKMLALVWGRAVPAEVEREKAALLALQRADGGWGQLPSLGTDAYATGQALWALHEAGMPSSAAAFGRGADYLLKTQLEDGTWFVRTRAFGFQPYFETGFPHGKNQFISTVATSWAALALSELIDTPTPTAQGGQ